MSEELFDDHPLPAQVKRDLDRAAAGIGRTPTHAHPDCICGKPTGQYEDRWIGYNGEPVPIRHTKADCPQHRPEPKR